MTDHPFVVTAAATWLARGRSPAEADALAAAWRDFPDLPPDAPLEARMARTRQRVGAMRPIIEAAERRTEQERRLRNFAFVAGKAARGEADARDRAILQGRDRHAHDWNEAVRYADGWVAAQAGWSFNPPTKASDPVRQAYEQGFRDGGGEPADLFDAARRSLLAPVAAAAPAPPQASRPPPSSWPKPTDDGRPVAWLRRLAILSEIDPELGDAPAGSPSRSAAFRDEIVQRSGGAATVILLSVERGFIAASEASPTPRLLTAERADALIADADQRARLRALLVGGEFEDLLVAAQGDHLRVIDAFAGALPLCRRMARTRNTPLQQRAHLRTWLEHGTAPGSNRGAGHIRWGKLAKGLTGKLGEFTARYGGKVEGGGHRLLVEVADGVPALGYATADGRPMSPEILFTSKARLRDEMATALRQFGGATRLIGHRPDTAALTA